MSSTLCLHCTGSSSVFMQSPFLYSVPAPNELIKNSPVHGIKRDRAPRTSEKSTIGHCAKFQSAGSAKKKNEPRHGELGVCYEGENSSVLNGPLSTAKHTHSYAKTTSSERTHTVFFPTCSHYDLF